MGIIGILIVANPELYGSLSQHLRYSIGDDDATLCKIHVMISSLLRHLQHNSIGGGRLLSILPCLINGSYGKGLLASFGRRIECLVGRQLSHKPGTLIDMIAGKHKAGSLRSCPLQHAILGREVGGRIQLLARHNHCDDGLTPAILDLHILLAERNLHALVLHLIIYNGCIVDMTATNSSCSCLHDEEVLERLGTIYSIS